MIVNNIIRKKEKSNDETFQEIKQTSVPIWIASPILYVNLYATKKSDFYFITIP